MAQKWKYKCRECPPPFRRRCIEEAQISPGIRRIIIRAFESHTDTQDTWDLLQRNCLLLLREQILAGWEEPEHGLLSRLRKSKEEETCAPEPAQPEPPPVVRPSMPEPGWKPNWEAELRAARAENPQEASAPTWNPSQESAPSPEELPAAGQSLAREAEQQASSESRPGTQAPEVVWRPSWEQTPTQTPGPQSPPAPPTEYLSGPQEDRTTAPIDTSQFRQPGVTESTRPVIQLHYPRVVRPQPAPDLPLGPRMLVGLLTGHRILLPSSDSLVLGRFDPLSRTTPDVDLTFEDHHNRSISRRHAQISAPDGQYEITDMGSSNGTWINGARLGLNERRTMLVGDEIRLGGCRLFFDQIPACWLDRRPVGQYFFYVTFSGHFIPLPDRDTILIGRQDPALRYRPDIDLSHEGGVASIISRRHARLTRQGHRFLIEDLGSAYETRINGQKVPIGKQVPIQPGQHLWLGGCTLAFDII